MIATNSAEHNALTGIDEKEWSLRVELAAVYRLVDMFGWSELIWTHSTARLAGGQHHFLINRYGLRFDEVCASNLVKVDMDGAILGGNGIHHPRFGYYLKERMDKRGIECIVKVKDDYAG